MRPDLAFSVGIASRFTERPNVSHLAPLKRILRYVKDTLGCGILFPATDMGRKYELFGYMNYNWHGDKDDRKSTTSYVFMFEGAAISRCSKKENVVEEVVTLLVDNVSTISLAKNLISHVRSKHIEMMFNYLRDMVSAGQLRLGYCRSEKQVANLRRGNRLPLYGKSIS
ncbi:secreted RxLR effector protein 161-like [Vicia villosa]|uniref:secreted RxLR effector protein 161-like n=1 Tax=Vicia villosa TaxID=3911 RepID=UPI00273B646C|nr:secreted RxLR effector protein 161-like [Vicia villosa]